MRIVRVNLYALLLSLVCAFSFSPALAQTSEGPTGTLSQSEIDRIVRAFTTRETEFHKALLEYAFKRDALIQILGMGGQVTGEYHRVSHFTFDDSGNRFEKIDYFPMASYEGITQEDVEDLGGVTPFALESTKAAQYDFKYLGKEHIDELDLYVFEVSPKVTPDAKKTKERFFKGTVWVDDHDLQIVKSRGKGIPETKKNKFPIVETYREQIDGKYWFPTYAYADDDLIFDSGEDVRIRIRVRYTDYQRARGKLRVIDMEGEKTEATTKPSKAPKGKPPQD
jgi:hypothetical protein